MKSRSLRYAVFDLDGTVIGQDGQVPHRLGEGLETLHRHGLLPILVTGRSLDGLRARQDVAGLLPLFDDELLLSNGDCHFDQVTGALRCDRVIPGEAVTRLLAAGIHDLVIEHEGRHIALTRRARLAYAIAYELSRHDVEVRSPDLPVPRPTAVVVLGAAPNRDVARLIETLAGLDCVVYPIEAFQAVVVHSSATSKAQALTAHLRRRFGEPGLERVIAFGDGDNDAELLAACQVGVAVAGSRPSALASANIRLREPLAEFLLHTDLHKLAAQLPT